MANNIKGITIEIGGDTSKLDSALKGIDSKTRSLSQELKQINNQLKFDPHNAVLLKQKFDVLSDQVEKTREKLKTLEDAQEQVERQFQNGEIDEGQYRAFQREIEKTKSQLNYFENEARDAKKDLDNLGNEADQTGNDFDELGRDAKNSAKQVGDGFNTTAINMSAMLNVVNTIGTVIQSAIQGAINLGKKIGGIIEEYLTTADEIATNSKKYGISTDTYQKLLFAADQVDVSADTIGSALGKISRNIGKTPEKFDELGVSVYDSMGNFRRAEDVFYDTIDALGKVENETEQETLANNLFGRSYQELEPLVYATSDALKAYGRQADDLGVIMDEDQLQAMNDAKDALDILHYQLGTLLAPVIEAIAPHIENIAKWLSEKLADPDVQEKIDKIAKAFGDIAGAFTDALIDLVESGKLEDLIDAVIDALPAITDFITNALPGLVQGLEDILGFMTGLSQPTADFDKKIQNLTKDSETFGSKGEAAAGIIKTAFVGGFGTIGNKITTVLDQAGLDADSFEYQFLTDFFSMKFNITDIFGQIQTTIGEKMGEAMGTVKQKFDDAWLKIQEWFDKIKKWFLDLPNKMSEWLKSIPEKIKAAFSGQASVSVAAGKVNIGYRGGYAEGGIFKKSSFVNIGEAGPEVVLPLDRLGQVLSSVGYSGGGIVVNAPVQVVKELNDAELNRVGGRLTDIVGRQFAKRTGGVL